MGWEEVKWFKSVEFESPDLKDSGALMNLDFVRKLDKLREAVKMPLTIVSGYRTSEHNDKVGGVDSSAHTSGHAADIAVLESGRRYQILEAAFRLGFRRIGIGNGFIHIDDDITKPQDVAWLYPSTEKRK